MSKNGLTKARSLGPIVEAIERQGGDALRVFRRAEVPFDLVRHPEFLIPLGDQLRLLEGASDEVGDPAFSLRLSLQVGVGALGAIGTLATGQPSLREAFEKTIGSLGRHLQSCTEQRLERIGRRLAFTYRLTEPIALGRQKNELLAIGYQIDLVRRFAGSSWNPDYVVVSGTTLDGRREIEDLLRCPVRFGSKASILLSNELLDSPNPSPTTAPPMESDFVPADDDFVAFAEHMIKLDLLDGRIGIKRLSRRLETEPRSLQRHLAHHGTCFHKLRSEVMRLRATEALKRDEASITDLAATLGYHDPAHFTRAFRSWTGMSPRDFRKTHRYADTAG